MSPENFHIEERHPSELIFNANDSSVSLSFIEGFSSEIPYSLTVEKIEDLVGNKMKMQEGGMVALVADESAVDAEFEESK